MSTSTRLKIRIAYSKNTGSAESPIPLLYKENHSLGEWFKKAYGDE